jgi:hypothetical protein
VVVLLVIFNNVLQCNVINCLQRILENLAKECTRIGCVHVIGTKVSLLTKQLTISLIFFGGVGGGGVIA